MSAPAGAPKLTDADQLHRLLSAVSPAAPVLDALPPPVRQELERQSNALSPEQRQLLLAAADPIVARRPLLYVAAGGNDLQITQLLFSSSAGSSEVVALLGERGDQVGLVAACNDIGRRAAQQLLRARAVDLAPGVERKAEHLQQVALAARLLERIDIERLALKLLAAESERPLEWELGLAELEARALNPELARLHLVRFSAALELAASESADPNSPASLARVAQAVQLRGAEPAARALIAAADVAKKSNAQLSSVEARVDAARAALELGLPDRASALLADDRAQLGKHLAYTTTYARALTQGNACPHVWPTLVNERLCRQAWAEALPKISAATLDSAWASGLGRDAWAVESYLGFAYVVPMQYGLDRAGKDEGAVNLGATFATLASRAEEAAPLGADFSAMALVARSLGAAVSALNAHPAEPAAIDKAQRSALLNAAAQLATTEATAWARSAALAVAAILVQQEPIAPVLDGLRTAELGSAKLTYGGLLLLDILADGDAARYDQHKALLGDLAVAMDASAFERSTWLFTWAEAEAHLVPGEASAGNLDRIAATLMRSTAPLELRMRATLDRAGLLARKGDLVGAAAMLEPVVSQTPRSAVSTAAEQELLVAATGYLLVLRGLHAQGDERTEYAKKLQAFLLDVTRANAAPPTLQMWLLMWSAELDALLQRAACGGRVACERKVDRQRGADPAKLSQALGARVSGLLAHGVVPVGGVQVEIRYQPSGHLTPEIQVSPAFLLAHVPPLAKTAPSVPKASVSR